MIVPITGNVNFTITLDPTVWIFDDRKVLMEDAFTTNQKSKLKQEDVYKHKIKPPVNKSISRFEREKILINTYLMPIKDFLLHAEIKDTAKQATIVSKTDEYIITLETLYNSYLLFAIKGKAIKENGPVHLYYGDGTNKNEPIISVQKIIID